MLPRGGRRYGEGNFCSRGNQACKRGILVEDEAVEETLFATEELSRACRGDNLVDVGAVLMDALR